MYVSTSIFLTNVEKQHVDVTKFHGVHSKLVGRLEFNKLCWNSTNQFLQLNVYDIDLIS